MCVRILYLLHVSLLIENFRYKESNLLKMDHFRALFNIFLLFSNNIRYNFTTNKCENDLYR